MFRGFTRNLASEQLESRELLDGSGPGLYLHFAELYTNSTLQQPGLVGSYINQSLHTVANGSDWRISQSVAGTRVDNNVEFLSDGWGPRSNVGLTHGSDGNWENFSVQWDGVVQVAASGQRFGTVSDDGSRMWIDLNRDGVFGSSEIYDNNWGGVQGMRTGDRTEGIPAGVYPIRIQYYERSGGNSFALASSPFVPRQFEPSSINPVQIVKVLVLNFDPHVPSEQNQKLHEVFGWSDPLKLASQFESDIEWATGGGVDIQIVEWRERDAFPIFEDGFRYNPDEYVQFRRSNSGWNAGTLDFRELVDQENLAPLVNSGAVDELWLFGDHYFNLLGEAWMAGPNSFFINGPTMSDVGFDRAISGYGFSYERSVGEMLHNLGHRVENHGQRAFGSWNLANPITAWDRFSSNYTDTLAGPYGVGTGHVPANADAHYDYGDRRTVLSTAHDFPDYPNMRGEARQVSRNSWSFGPVADEQRDYLNWYLAMMPRNDGTDSNGRSANWYKYIWDYNSYEAGTGQPRQQDAYGSAQKVKLPGALSHEVTVRYYDVDGINQSTIGNDDVTIISPGNFSLPATYTGVSRIVNTTAGKAATVTYRFTPPGGVWDSSDNGVYRIRTNTNGVRDELGNVFPALEVGQFEVAIPRTDQINVREMLRTSEATVTHSTLDAGPLSNLFDDQSNTLIRTPSINPAVVTLSFQNQQTVQTFRTYFSHAAGNPAYRYSVEIAQTLADLDNRSGTYQRVVDAISTASDRFDEVTLQHSVSGRVFRLTGTRLTGDNFVHINEWQLFGNSSVDNEPPTVAIHSIPKPVMGAGSQFLTLVYTDQSGVRVPSLGNGDIVIAGPNGIFIEPVIYDVDGIGNGSRREATYWFLPPGGTWDEADYGLYTIIAKTGTVTDVLHQSHPQDRIVGTFSFDTDSPPRLSIQSQAATRPEGNSGSTNFTFTAIRSGNKSDGISVNYFVSGIGSNPATANDFVGGLPSGIITFPPNVITTTLTVQVQGDALVEHNEGFKVALSNPSGSGLIDVSETLALIENDDFFDFSLSETTISENAGMNATVGTFSTKTAHSSDSYLYTLVNGFGDADNASFNISGLTLRATSSFDFESKLSYTIRVRSTNQEGLFSEKVFLIVVTDVNDVPIALSDSFWVSLGTSQILQVLDNDLGVAGSIDRTTIEIVRPPENGVAIPEDGGTISYTPNAGFRGTEILSYRVKDLKGAYSNEAIVTLRVNSAPRAGADSFVVEQNTAVFLDVLGNDIDPDGSIQAGSLTIVSQSSMADLTVMPDGWILFTPRNGYLGSTNFQYIVSDNEGRSSELANVTVLVVVTVYQNPRNRYDVDGDQTVSPLDVLSLINLINEKGPSISVDGLPGPPDYVDVNGDNRLDPIDVLEIVNFINSQKDLSGEGESGRAVESFWQEAMVNTWDYSSTSHVNKESSPSLSKSRSVERRTKFNINYVIASKVKRSESDFFTQSTAKKDPSDGKFRRALDQDSLSIDEAIVDRVFADLQADREQEALSIVVF